MPSLYELDSEPEDNLLGDDGASESSEPLLQESAPFIHSRDRPRKKATISRVTAFATFVLVVVVFTVAVTSSIRRPQRKIPEVNDPAIEELEAQYFHEYNSQRVRIKYGPYEVPPSHVDNGMKNFVQRDAIMPCYGCLITWFQADLLYEDGSRADADTGMWLHHTVLTNAGRDDVKGCKYDGERFFASGNERTLVDIGMNGTEKSGYYLSDSDPVWMMTELMNAQSTARSAVLTITYEYIPSRHSDFNTVIPVWLDIGGCSRSDLAVPPNLTSFRFSSPSWTSSVSGRIISVLGHLHDGGTHLDVTKYNESVCRSVPKYGDEGTGHGHGHGHSQGQGHDLTTRHGGGTDMSHISEMTMCHNIGRIEDGEEWAVTAEYDIAAHPPMLDSTGEAEGVMGIAVIYIAED